MSTVFMQFFNVLAWASLGLCALVVALITVGRATQTKTDRLVDRIQGRTWRSRVPFVLLGGVCSARLWSYYSVTW